MRVVRVALVAILALATPAFATPARADWFFGLFGGSESAPAPRPGVAVYSLRFETDDSSLLQPLRDSSNLYRLRDQPPASGEGLARRAEMDLPRLVDTLWAEGFYDAAARAYVAGQEISLGGAGLDRAAAAADRLIGKEAVPVRIEIQPGALYRIGVLRFFDVRTGRPLAPDLTAYRIIRLKPGDPARANAIRAMQSRIINALRRESYPLAKVTKAEAYVRHDQRLVDVDVRVDPGEKAGFGAVSVSGARTFDPAIARSFIYVRRGDPITPERLAAMRKSLSQISIIGSTRILEADHLDPSGDLPVTVAITERKKHEINATALYSTVDGPTVSGQWADRNLLGGAERLSLGATVGVSAQDGGARNLNALLDPQRLIGRGDIGFFKPALWGSRNDFLADFTAARDVAASYTAQFIDTTAAIRHRFSEEFYAQGGVEVTGGTSTDPFGRVDYTLAGATAALHYDTTDNALDPTKGVRASLTAVAYPTWLGSSINLFSAQAQVSTYYSLDEDGWYVLAGRVEVGGETGAPVLAIPDNLRFFVGGGGTVRGYAYRSLSPLGPNNVPKGGESMFVASLEARLHVTQTIGVVPFCDAGAAYASSFPDFQQEMRYACGLGLRYYTGVGPIRLDLAAPIARRTGEAPVAFYIGVGQAF